MGTASKGAGGPGSAVLGLLPGVIILSNVTKYLSILFVYLFIVSFVFSSPPEGNKEPPRASGESISGRIQNIDQQVQTLTVRTGDATTTFSFDNKTVFTYGDQKVSADDLKIGQDVLVQANQGKAAEINGTQQIEGIIERIDKKGQKLIVKIGDTIKEIPFIFFRVTTPEGQVASVDNMNIGDSVFLNVNVGFADKTKPKK